jgi:hypothetical protein
VTRRDPLVLETVASSMSRQHEGKVVVYEFSSSLKVIFAMALIGLGFIEIFYC